MAHGLTPKAIFDIEAYILDINIWQPGDPRECLHVIQAPTASFVGLLWFRPDR